MADLENISGLKELADAMRKLPENVAKNALRGHVNSMATVIRNEIVARAPEDTGALKANIYQKQIRERSGQFQQTYFVGVRRGKARYANNKANKRSGKAGQIYENGGATFYWRFLEFGTSKLPQRQFIRPAFEEKKTDAVERGKEYLEKRLHKEAQKLRGK